MLYLQISSAPVQPRFERLQQQQQAGRNQEANSRLQMKADELERLFAEHKRRAHHREATEAEQSSGENNSERRTIGCRGELYERYMEKRESKLRKEWGLKREERSATMKALRESLERTSAELKLQQELRSTTTNMMKRDGRDQVLQLVKNNLSEEEEEDEQSDTYSYKSVNSKLLPTKRTMSSSSSVRRNSNRAIPRPSAAKATAATGNSARGSGSKNSSDTRKENTKPSIPIVASKPSTNLPRSKSTSTVLSSSSSIPSRKFSATPLKPLTLPKEQSPKSAVYDVDVSSPTASTASTSGRTRKKWASVAGPDASCQPPRKDTGIKRLLQFGRKKKQGAESVVDAECSPAGGARDDREDGTAAASEVVMSKSRLEANFSDGAIALEQVQTRGSSMAAAASPANCKLEEVQSPRGVPRSFFSLPPFRNREGDSKLGR